MHFITISLPSNQADCNFLPITAAALAAVSAEKLSIHLSAGISHTIMKQLRRLLFSHIDAWCVALVAAGLPLLIHNAITPQTIWLLLSIVGTYWLAFVLNDWYDVAHDTVNPIKRGRNFFVRMPLTTPQMMAVTGVVLLILMPGFLQYGRRGWISIVVGAVAAWAYSAPPLRIKSRPVFDLLTHMLFVESFPYWLVMFLLRLQWQPLDFALLTMALLGSLTAQLEQQARDFESDRLTDRNFTTTYGLAPNLWLLKAATILLIVVGVSTLLLGIVPWYFAPFGLLALPMMLRRFRQKEWQPASQQLVYFLAGMAAIYFVAIVVFLR